MPAMPRPDLGDRERWLAVGLLIGALALVYLLGLHWWWTAPMLERQGEIDELRTEELRLRMHASQRPAIEARLAEVREFEQGNPGFLPEATSELATAGLVQRLETVVAQASEQRERCTITNRTPTTSRAEERFPRVVVQVRLRCGVEEFANVLHALEGGRPQLFIENLNIQNRRNFLAPGAQQSGAILDIYFDLYGYLRTAGRTGGGDA